MRLVICFIVLTVFIASGCQELHKRLAPRHTHAGNEYQWTKHTDSAAFPKSYNFQLLNIRDTLWALHPTGNWFSTDGKNWTKSPLENAISNPAFLDYTWFRDALYGLGRLEGNIEHNNFSPVISRTTDMRHWTIASRESNLPHRFFYYPFVFHDKLWIIGGSDGQQQFADTWSSEDAVHWKQELRDNGLGGREHSQFVVLRDSLYMFNNDVWRSADALHWTKISGAILDGQQVFGYAAVVYDNRIWLLGCNRNGQFASKVFFSRDGVQWESTDAPWSPRGAMGACVFKNAVYVTGGKYGGTPDAPNFIYSNDVWSMSTK
jgi:hypothetical protein